MFLIETCKNVSFLHFLTSNSLILENFIENLIVNHKLDLINYLMIFPFIFRRASAPESVTINVLVIITVTIIGHVHSAVARWRKCRVDSCQAVLLNLLLTPQKRFCLMGTFNFLMSRGGWTMAAAI